MIFGKIVAGLLGLFVGGPIGLVVGVVIGHLFDRGLRNAMLGGTASLAELQQHFFRTTFLLMGYIAKSDGRVSEEEVAHTEQVFQQLGLQDEQRNDAILLFKEGTGADFDLETTVDNFLRAGGSHQVLKQTMLMFLIALAFADLHLDGGERDALHRVGGLLGYNAQTIDELLRMATAQGSFHGGGATSSSAPSIEDAYAALGVSTDASDAQVKRAYRKLMSEHHPDKLMAQGVPEDMLKLATRKSQEIQAAYELIRKSRGTGRAG